jgi:hypothetical protein
VVGLQEKISKVHVYLCALKKKKFVKALLRRKKLSKRSGVREKITVSEYEPRERNQGVTYKRNASIL